MSLDQKRSRSSIQSVQEVSKHRLPRQVRHAKSDVRYWQRAIFRPSYTRGGVRQNVGHWVAKVQHAGRRETIPLGTPNKAAAADKAKKFYLCLQAEGWDEALRKFKPKSGWSNAPVTTVGEFIRAAESVWSGNPKTIRDYGRAFRQIVSDVFQIDGGTSKFDYRSGGRDAWVQKSAPSPVARNYTRSGSKVEGGLPKACR
jgi:hypothetical protein